MANMRDIICFDYETGGANPLTAQPTQIAAIAIHGRKLTLQPGGVFNSEIRPIIDDEKAIEAGVAPLEEKALEITRKNRKDLAKAPPPKIVWGKFAEFVNQYNWKNTSFTAPIAAGFNIIGYDMPIVNRMCKEFGPYDEKKQQQKLFNPIFKIDLMDHIYCWFENNQDVKSYNMDYLREYFGLPKDNAHDALQDVKDTANILIKFLKLQRNLLKKVRFEKSFADGERYIV
jgi:DNA polymerase III epsilon subunit-like protein